MTLRRRLAVTAGWNVALFVGPWSLYQASRAVTIYGAYHGWWPLAINT